LNQDYDNPLLRKEFGSTIQYEDLRDRAKEIILSVDAGISKRQGFMCFFTLF
jgi:hypothetical protein